MQQGKKNLALMGLITIGIVYGDMSLERRHFT